MARKVLYPWTLQEGTVSREQIAVLFAHIALPGILGLRLRVKVSGFQVQDLGFRIQGSGFRMWSPIGFGHVQSGW